MIKAEDIRPDRSEIRLSDVYTTSGNPKLDPIIYGCIFSTMIDMPTKLDPSAHVDRCSGTLQY
jgi:hypothetical protein